MQHELGHAVAIEVATVERKAIPAIGAEFRRRDIERQRRVDARSQSGVLDGANQHRQRIFVGFEYRPIAAFVGDARELAGLLHQRSGGAVDVRDHCERRAQRFCADRHHHQVLDVDSPSCMGATAENLDFGQWQRHGLIAGDVSP